MELYLFDFKFIYIPVLYKNIINIKLMKMVINYTRADFFLQRSKNKNPDFLGQFGSGSTEFIFNYCRGNKKNSKCIKN